MIVFDWDVKKDKANQRKHGVSFNEAKSVFFDEFAVQFLDEGHSEEEERFLMLGISNQSRTLLVCHCARDNETTIRIISARKATRSESKLYDGGSK